ncbi:MAG: hypothetical protein MUC35_01905 [Candidatus Margulisbacteria bacterium]|jgi:Tfp pilus assembly protein PilW|nr:hypothetical protein [Candidatus Margulisiibacteriota bacterium]
MSRISKGFTLVEVLLASLLSGLLIVLVISAYLAGARLFENELSQSDLFWSGQQAAETMAARIRESQAATDPQSDRLTLWWRDLDNDASAEADELLTYSVSGESLLETTGGTGRGLARAVHSLVFSYDGLTDPKLVTATLTLSSESTVITIESVARIRNQ